MISANIKLSNRVQIEYHDGEDYAGDRLVRIQLGRSRMLAFFGRGQDMTLPLNTPMTHSRSFVNI